MATEKQIASNRKNALKSTGPRTPEGQARSKWNALKHGILAKAVVAPPYTVTVGGKGHEGRDYWPTEDGAEFKRLHRALCEELQPMGVLEGMLVEKIACMYWRLRRVYAWEAAKVAQRRAAWLLSLKQTDDEPILKTEADYREEFYKRLVEAQRQALKLAESGPLDKEKLAQLKKLFEINVDQTFMGMKLDSLTVKQSYIEELLNLASHDPRKLKKELSWQVYLYDHGKAEEEARKALSEQLQEQASCLPDIEELQKVARYEAHLSKQLYKALHELIRLQAARTGKDVPLPAALDVTMDGELGSFGKNHDGV